MSLSLSTMVRLFVLVAVVANAAAIGVSKIITRPTTQRIACSTSLTTINGYFLPTREGRGRLIDASTGTISTLPIPLDEKLDHASLSPWRDDRGQSQMVGRWASVGESPTTPEGRGLARYSFPDGALLDRIQTDILPVGPPCWFPGTTLRVIFPAGDGQLYVTSFGDESTQDGTTDQPRLLQWNVDSLEGQNFSVNELAWPREPEFHGKLIAMIALPDPINRTRFLRPRPWWIELNASATAVVDAVPFVMDDGLFENCNLRCPAVIATGPGELSLLLISRSENAKAWRAWAIPLNGEESDGSMCDLKTSEARLLVEGCVPSIPAISEDHRWLACLADRAQGPPQILRVPLQPTMKPGSSEHLAILPNDF